MHSWSALCLTRACSPERLPPVPLLPTCAPLPPQQQVRRWEDLPPAARDSCQWVEDRLGVHCKWIGVGPGRDAVVVKPLGR